MENSKDRRFLQSLKTLAEMQLLWIIEKDKYSAWQKEHAQRELDRRRIKRVSE